MQGATGRLKDSDSSSRLVKHGEVGYILGMMRLKGRQKVLDYTVVAISGTACGE
jgi:hypothetical protein